MNTRRPALNAISLITAIGIATTSCHHLPGKQTQKDNMQTMSQSAAQSRTEEYIDEVAQLLPPEVRLFKNSGGPAPCGEESEVEDLPQGGTNPYIFATFARADNVPPHLVESIVPLLRAGLDRENWKITDFQPATNGRTITDLKALNQSDKFGVSIEMMHPERRLIVSVGSPCLRHPLGDNTHASRETS